MSEDPRREGFCDDCKSEYETWFAASVYWNAAVRSQGDEPMLCASCFAKRAAAFYPNAVWKLSLEGDESAEIRWSNEKISKLNQETLDSQRRIAALQAEVERLRGALEQILSGSNRALSSGDSAKCEDFCEDAFGLAKTALSPSTPI